MSVHDFARVEKALAALRDGEADAAMDELTRVGQASIWTFLDAEIEAARALAPARGKVAPEVHCEGDADMGGQRVGPLLSGLVGHALRNAVDHGLETAHERAANGKEEQGRLTLRAAEDGEFVEITIADDGVGLDLEALRRRGEALGVLDEEAGADEVAAVAFCSGVSTAREVDEVSGRGVGMDAIRTTAREHGGNASIELLGPPTPLGRAPFCLRLRFPRVDHIGARDALAEVA